MLDLRYLFPRVIRHFMPPRLARFLLLKRWIIRPGLETDSPKQAAERYRKMLTEYGVDLQDKRVLILGYGGRFSVGCALLKTGAAQVVLCEWGIHPDHHFNQTLLAEYSDLLTLNGQQVVPADERLEVIEGDIRQLKPRSVDVILSTSVYEHLDDVKGITRALADLTNPDGMNFHYIDIRDHYFLYPFEMLCYSESVWQGWLNPTTNHNRYRLPDYRKVFETYFARVDIKVMARNEAAFNMTRARIRSEFLSGDPHIDSVTQITVFAETPKKAENPDRLEKRS